jgi:phenylacetate-CoA ligase
MHPALVRHIVKPLLNRIDGRQATGPFLALEQSQWFSPEAIHDLQWTKLRALLRHVYTSVPYYREVFHRLGASPEDIQRPEDLKGFPTLTKQIVRDRGQDLVAEGPLRLLRRVTSGSTGIPLQTYIDRGCQDWWLAAERRRRRWWGIDIGTREAKLITSHLSRKRFLACYLLLNEASYFCGDLSEAGLRRLTRQLIRFRPASLRGRPSVLAYYGQFLLDHVPVGAGPMPKVVSCTAELMYPDQRAVMREAFRCPVVNEYGSTENELLAVECPQGRMHIMAENHLLEYRPVSGGDAGITEILVTDLNNYGMPFIRYELGDVGSPLDDRCPCGRGLPLLDLRGGRTADLAITPGGVLDPGVFARIFEAVGIGRVRRFQVIQEALDRFTLLIAGDGGAVPVEEITHRFRRVLGPGAFLEIRIVVEIPDEPSGKLRRFVSRLTHPLVRDREGDAAVIH